MCCISAFCGNRLEFERVHNDRIDRKVRLRSFVELHGLFSFFTLSLFYFYNISNRKRTMLTIFLQLLIDHCNLFSSSNTLNNDFFSKNKQTISLCCTFWISHRTPSSKGKKKHVEIKRDVNRKWKVYFYCW